MAKQFLSAISCYPGAVGSPGLYLGSDTSTGFYRIGANNIGVAISGSKVVDISSTGLNITGTIAASAVSVGVFTNGVKESYFGYSSTYKVIQLGALGANSAISLGADLTGNSSGSFTGNEIVIPNNKAIIAPNAANSGYVGVLRINSSNILELGSADHSFATPYMKLASGTISMPAIVTATGNISLPTATSTDAIYAHNNTYGAVLYGYGSTYDTALLDRNTNPILGASSSGITVNRSSIGDSIKFGSTGGSTGYLYSGSGVAALLYGANGSGAGFGAYSAYSVVYSPNQSTYISVADTGVAVTGKFKIGSLRFAVFNTSNYGFALTNGLKIKTNIPGGSGYWNDNTTTLWIEGYDYRTGSVFNVALSWYGYSGGNTFYNQTITSYGGIAPTATLSIESGKVVINFALNTGGLTDYYYGYITVRSYDLVNGDTAYTGWTVVDEGVTGTQSVTLTYKNRFQDATLDGTVKLPNLGTSGFVKLSAGGQLVQDTSTYLPASSIVDMYAFAAAYG